MSPARAVIVTGANGYIGNAVCLAFVRAGWTVYGLVRKENAMPPLASEEIIPVLGSPGDLSFLPLLLEQQGAFDAIVSTTEQIENYEDHFNEIMAMLRALSEASNAAGKRPLVLFTSGCKDYGLTLRADSPDLAPHTEASPLNPPDVLAPRAFNATKVFENTDLYDAVVLRPTTVFGRSSSYYGPFFELAQQAKDRNEPLRLPAHPSSVVHGTHVDDCAEAYVSIAEAERNRVAGQCYNISSHRYETLEEVSQALAVEYRLTQGVAYDPPEKFELVGFDVVGALTGFSQWVGSEKLRSEVGWSDRRRLFSEGLKAYRIAYEEASRQGHSNVLRVKEYVKASDDFKAGHLV